MIFMQSDLFLVHYELLLCVKINVVLFIFKCMNLPTYFLPFYNKFTSHGNKVVPKRGSTLTGKKM